MNAEFNETYSLRTFLSRLSNPSGFLDLDIISYAFKFSEVAHAEQFRKSGEPYFIHCFETALILSEIIPDTDTIAAGLLHDILEDTQVDNELIEEHFGEKIRFLIEGVTKFQNIQYKGGVRESMMETYRNLFSAMGRDPRVLLIKCADRLHNMRTLEHLSLERQLRIAQETLDIYAPLAHRYGIGKIKWELEDLSFKYLDHNEYLKLSQQLSTTRVEQEKILNNVINKVLGELETHGIFAELSSRPKHLYSIFRKIKSKEITLHRIFDLLAIRIITKTKEECYFALGLIHNLFKPIDDRFKDYIANPKKNFYQSIHTTVMIQEGKIIEFQIRTRDMHVFAEIGIAAHWIYKEGKKKISESEVKRVEMSRMILDWDQMDKDEFINSLKEEAFEQKIYVFTPKEEPFDFIRGATVLDFAFAIHTDVGLHCISAKVNNRIVPLNTELDNFDRVEIITSPHKTPSRDWLDYVKTAKAKSRVKNWFKKEGLIQAAEVGRSIFEQYIRKNRLQPPNEETMKEVFSQLGYNEIQLGYAAIGNADLSVTAIMSRLYPKDQTPKTETTLQKLINFAKGQTKGIRLDAISNLMYTFAKCCQPIPGDDIVGFISRGKGIIIHKSDCRGILRYYEDNDRLVKVYWDISGEEQFLAHLQIQAKSNPAVLSDVSHVIIDQESKVLQLKMKEEDFVMNIGIAIQIRNLSHLSRIMLRLKKLKGVYLVKRI